MPKAPVYVDRGMRRDGRGRYAGKVCAGCKQVEGRYRCKKCVGSIMYCSRCIVADHYANPLHRIEVRYLTSAGVSPSDPNEQMWNGSYFERTSLKDAGLVVQLGHKPGNSCPFGSDGHKHFVVMEADHIQEVSIRYCGCEDEDHDLQLLDYGWWPGTVLEPQTVATMDALHDWHMRNLVAHTTVYDYVRTMEMLTDNTGLVYVRVRVFPVICFPTLTFRQPRAFTFGIMVREWRYYEAVRRAGIGHKIGTVSSIEPGELAVECPACPQCGRNLPEGWQDSPEA